MISFFLILLSTLVGQSLLNAVAVLLHVETSLLLVAPIVLVISIFCLETLEALWVLMFVGIVIDSLTGSLAGLNMWLLVFLGAAGIALSSWLGKPHWPMIVSFLLGVSFVYRMILAQMGNYEFLNLLLGPCVDACVGFLIFYSLPRRVIKMD